MTPEQTYRLAAFGVDDVRACTEAIRTVGGGAETLRETAQAIAEFLYGALVDDDGRPACALVRLYKTHPFGRLEPDLQDFARGFLDDEPHEDLRCLTLLGTAGDRPEWNDAALSQGHRAIPLPSEEVVHRLPMVAQLITQLGIDVGHVVSPPRGADVIPLSQQTNDVFHVEHAPGSPYLPAQDDFVVPEGIRSAVGFGGILLTGDFYAMVLFSRVAISDSVARTLKILALPMRVRLLPFAQARLARR
ncbi:MAG TPA: hypothetical protein VM204_04650 [Gaiellaceae bacterium]|nr:hypothetical protein [Gaiellaceae bacterium]